MFKEYPDVVDVSTLAEMLQISRKAAYALLQTARLSTGKSDASTAYLKRLSLNS